MIGYLDVLWEAIMATAVVFLADGFEEVEALTPVDYLRRAKVCVKTVAVPTAAMKQENLVGTSHLVPVVADLTFAEFEKEFSVSDESSLPDLVFLPGGMPGSKNLGDNEKVIAFVKKCFESGKYVSAICAAPAVALSKTGALKGRKWTCFPEMNKDVPADLVKDSTFVESPFVTDGNVITGRGAGAAEQFAMELVRLLCGKETADFLKEKTVQR